MVKMDELQALSYFSTVSHISRKVALQEKSLIKHLGNKWADYSPEYQEEILDDLCVPHSYRDEQFGVADDDFKFPSCWPTLKLPSGEKIIVDENDVCCRLLDSMSDRGYFLFVCYVCADFAWCVIETDRAVDRQQGWVRFGKNYYLHNNVNDVVDNDGKIMGFEESKIASFEECDELCVTGSGTENK